MCLYTPCAKPYTKVKLKCIFATFTPTYPNGPNFKNENSKKSSLFSGPRNDKVARGFYNNCVSSGTTSSSHNNSR